MSIPPATRVPLSGVAVPCSRGGWLRRAWAVVAALGWMGAAPFLAAQPDLAPVGPPSPAAEPLVGNEPAVPPPTLPPDASAPGSTEASPVDAPTAAVSAGATEELSLMDLLDQARVLATGDRLIYQVAEEREPPVPLFVNDRGEVEVPLLGSVPVAGRTCRELAFELKRRLEVDFFHRATVSLRFQFAENTRGKFNIAGAVINQGSYPIPSDQILTVSGAILRAGGFAAGADRTKVALIRRGTDPGSAESRATIDIGRIFDEGRFDEDLAVQADDLVVVPRFEEASGGLIYVLGAVNSPGLMPISLENMTVSQAILRAGGFTRFARTREVKLLRADPSLAPSEKTLLINVDEILQKGLRDQDPVVKPNDIIRVEEKIIAF